MKIIALILTSTLPTCSAFLITQQRSAPSLVLQERSTRQEFVHDAIQVTSAAMLGGMVVLSTGPNDIASARGRATLEVAYRKFTPRIIAGAEFYQKDMKQLVATANFEGIQNALREPPTRVKDDLRKPDSGVAERARQAGEFSNSRVLAAADLYASAFSESSISLKTKKMQTAVSKLRNVVEEMESVCKQALGQEQSGGLFGIGAKKVDKNELSKRLRQLYVDGGNAYNEYVLAANTDLAMQFDKLPYVK